MTTQTPARSIFRKLPRIPPLQRQVNFGALFMLLLCLNGGIALIAAMLRSRIYDDQFIFVYLVAVAASMATSAWWYFRSPKRGQEVKAQGAAVSGRGKGESHEKKRKKKRK